MDERTQVLAGAVLIAAGAVIFLLFALPSSLLAIPVPLTGLAALGLAAGTLLIGTSEGTV